MLPDTAEHRQDTIQLQARLAAVMSMLAAQRTAVERLRGERDTLCAERDTFRAERDTANTEVEKLRLMIRQLQRAQYGQRSERLDPGQLQLGLLQDDFLAFAETLRHHAQHIGFSARAAG